MAGVYLEVKYFNSFTVKNTIKKDQIWQQYEPFPGKVVQRHWNTSTISIASQNTLYWANSFTFQMDNDASTPALADYQLFNPKNLNDEVRLPSFYSLPYYNSTYGNSWHNFPVYNNDFFFPDQTAIGNEQKKFSQVIPFDSWYIEEARIRGGYNNTATDYGVRSYLQNDDQNKSTHRFSSLIYSGVYNSRTGINRTNVFSIGENITKTVEPAYGSIERLYAEDTNLTVFQEDKISRSLVDKDAIYSAEGGGTVTSSNLVLGQIQPYLGEFGIGNNPESFAYFGYRKYNADKNRNAILRLSRDGITEISQYGMSDYFRDELRNIDSNDYRIQIVMTLTKNLGVFSSDTLVGSTVTSLVQPGMSITNTATNQTGYIDYVVANSFSGVAFTAQSTDTLLAGDYLIEGWQKDKIIGGWDENSDLYTITLNKEARVAYPPAGTTTQAVDVTAASSKTLTFDESVLGWTSFLSFVPDQMFSLKGNFYTTQGDSIYKHYSDTSNRANFYGTQGDMNITFIFNDNPSVTKNFKTVNYEGSNGWEVTEMFSDNEGVDNGSNYNDTIKPIKSYDEGVYVENGVTKRVGFTRKENRYVANIRSNNATRPGQVIINPNGENVAGVKGYFTTVKIEVDNTTDLGGAKELFSVGSEFSVSSY
jgi:hypothetical protein